MSTDRVQIIERLADVSSALDSRDWDALGALFTVDATAYGATGRSEIVTVVRAFLGGCGPSQHLLGNHRVELEFDDGHPDGEQHARSRTYARVLHLGATGTELEGLTYECFGEYTDLWTRGSGGWRIRSRKFHVSFDRGDFSVLRPD